MKFDKDFLVKHKFWVMVVACVPLCLAAIVILATVVGPQISGARKKLEDKVAALAKSNKAPIKTPKQITLAGLLADIVQSKENDVWKKAWDQQATLFKWPKNLEERFDYQNGWFATSVTVSEPKMEEEGAEPVKLPADVVQGIVQTSNKEHLIILGADKKTTQKVYATANVKVSGEAKDRPAIKYWKDIQENDVVKVTVYKGKYFMDPLTDPEIAEFTKYPPDTGVYQEQINEILEQVQPVDTYGKGVVQLKGWAYQKGEMPPSGSKFLTFVSNIPWKVKADISEEAWLAQEDLWIQKELYRLVRQANDYISKFTKDENLSKGKVQVYRNPYFELKIAWDGSRNMQIAVKNLLGRRQKLDVVFLMSFNENAKANPPEQVLVGGEPLAPFGQQGDERTIPITLVEGGIRTGLFGVEQALNWETAAVKRIVQISLGSAATGDVAHSHRTFVDGLTGLVKEEEKKDAGAGDGKGPPMDKKNFGQPGAKGQDNAQVLANGVNKNRYVDMVYENRRSRRVPVAISMIVDQDHVDRVQTSFANSTLRFLTTQVLLNRYPYSAEPVLAGNAAAADGPKQGPMGVKAPPGMGPMGNFPKGPVFGPKGFPMGGGRQDAGGGGSGTPDELETNVEMVVYGIVTLYERYPARPPLTPGADPSPK